MTYKVRTTEGKTVPVDADSYSVRDDGRVYFSKGMEHGGQEMVAIFAPGYWERITAVPAVEDA